MTFGLEHGAFPRASRLWRPGARARKKRHEKVFFPREPLTNLCIITQILNPKGRSPTVMEVFVTCRTRRYTLKKLGRGRADESIDLCSTDMTTTTLRASATLDHGREGVDGNG